MKPVKTLIWILVLVIQFTSCNTKAKRIEAQKAYIAAVDAYGTENFSGSLELVRNAIRLDGNFYEALLLEGKILFFLDKAEEAGNIFAGLVSRYPAFTEARIWHIRCLILKGDFITARSTLDKELSFNQSDWRIFNLYSLLADRTDNYEERLSMNRRAEVILSTSARVYIDLALIWRNLGLNDRAQTYLEKAALVSGTSVSVRELEKAVNGVLKEE